PPLLKSRRRTETGVDESLRHVVVALLQDKRVHEHGGGEPVLLPDLHLESERGGERPPHPLEAARAQPRGAGCDEIGHAHSSPSSHFATDRTSYTLGLSSSPHASPVTRACADWKTLARLMTPSTVGRVGEGASWASSSESSLSGRSGPYIASASVRVNSTPTSPGRRADTTRR